MATIAFQNNIFGQSARKQTKLTKKKFKTKKHAERYVEGKYGSGAWSWAKVNL